MWIPKWYWKKSVEKLNDLERRVKRLELILLADAENKIASLRDEKAGTVMQNGILTVEEIANQRVKNID